MVVGPGAPLYPSPSSGRVGWGLFQQTQCRGTNPTPTLPKDGEGEESLRLDALDDVGEARAVLVPHRLHGVLERLLVGDLEHLDAGGSGLAHGFFLVGGPQRALLALRL